MHNLSNMPSELLQALEPLAQERVNRAEQLTLLEESPAPFNAKIITAFSEYHDALKWRDQIRREFARRGILGPPFDGEVS